MDQEAHWIWANTGTNSGSVDACTGSYEMGKDTICSHPDNEVACRRYTTNGGRRINCNAARQRYQEDYLQISACHHSGGRTAAGARADFRAHIHTHDLDDDDQDDDDQDVAADA